jgi:hypothetical protein
MTSDSALRVSIAAAALLLKMAQPVGAQRITIDPRPALSISGTSADGANIFGRIAGATRLADGTTVVGDASENTLVFFNSSGQLTRRAGRRGQGPGEFQMLRSVRQCARDSLFAVDASGSRVSVFSVAGDFVRQFSLPAGTSFASCSMERTLALLRTGAAAQPTERAVQWQLRVPLLLADTRGTVTRNLDTVLVGEIAVSGNGWLPRPGAPSASVALGDDRVVVCPGDSAGLATYSVQEGTRLPSVALRVALRVPSRRFVERTADRQTAAIPAGAFRDSLRQRLLRIPAAEYLPPCSKVLMDPQRNLWVVLSQPGDSVTVFRVFGRDNRVLGDVTVPAELDVQEIGSDYLLASGESAEGEPWVRVYRVRRSPAR